MGQQLALCTYKDPDQPPTLALDQAFEHLDRADLLASTDDPETLGIAGAIFKRKWQHENNKLYLERSLSYYLRGYRLYDKKGWHEDQGYNAVNAAFVLDQLGFLENKEAIDAQYESTSAKQRFTEAEVIRSKILNKLSPLLKEQEHAWMNKKWWVLTTIGEACFGLGQYDKALGWLKKADNLKDVPDWERESTARQLAALLRIRLERQDVSKEEESEARRVLRKFLGSDAAVLSVIKGKIGLALSGGGFRASFYHIGVLARLAELDLLRHVEVISCVSGGSIVGAHYYLEVRHLLQNVPEKDIKRDDYIKIVKRLEKVFLSGVQTNIRIQVVTDMKADMKMIYDPDYSRTKRLGELYEEQLYAKVEDYGGDKPRYISGLRIIPKDCNVPPK